MLCELEKDSFVVLIAVNFAEAIYKQLRSYDVMHVYNLNNLNEEIVVKKNEIEYQFIDRKKGKENLCYILAGYGQDIWEGTLARIEKFQSREWDYCLVSSGKYDEYLNIMAEKNGWSYLYTAKNQVCCAQNLVLEHHPEAKYIIKMDEDMFIGKDFFHLMLKEYKEIEKKGDYRIGFAVPVIPLNCSGYISYLNLIGKREEFEKKFGRSYRNRFSAVFSVLETAEYLWDTIDNFDFMAEKFTKNMGWEIIDSYFNIGCIMYTRERWCMMGKWPEDISVSGMGMDEVTIYEDNMQKDMSIYEIKSVLVGHLAFGHQKGRMMEYYKNNKQKFCS